MSLTSGQVSDDLIKAWITTYLEDGETRLVVVEIKSVWKETIRIHLSPKHWAALPVSRTIAPKGGCPDVYTNAGISCTCLEGYEHVSAWEFYIQARQELTRPPKLAPNLTDPLGLTSVMTIFVPRKLTSITLVNLMETLLLLTLTDETTGWNVSHSSPPSLLKLEPSATLPHITLDKIDLNVAISSTPDYLPRVCTSMQWNHTSKRRDSLLLDTQDVAPYQPSPSMYVQTFATLDTLDLSHSHLDTTDLNDLCPLPSHCNLQSINLGTNALTQLPTHLLTLPHLTSLNLDTKAIPNFTLSPTQFHTLTQLTNFTLYVPHVIFVIFSAPNVVAHDKTSHVWWRPAQNRTPMCPELNHHCAQPTY
ncbi:hypothetical protein PsorP6_016973 [Peronosclerospora sorghi]|uniref:Uncharacterized protein n=1 Tax=Peronosclerospora sorghi TaxID=230839 RepID=A0ACC0WDL4_9STRA|nr:hypothetical protein PsorP6_016973 [Peronosclerospora sorghi]